jgi:chromosome segregation ATPase
MATEHSHSPETDLEKTDRLPILDEASFAHDGDDDAANMDHGHTAVMPGPTVLAASSVQPDFVRPSGVDLPSLAESVRSVEERIARQNAEYEALTRAFERAQDAESASATRANALAVDLAAARTALESEQNRSRELDRILADKSSSIESARSRVEEAQRESDRFQGEARNLRESLATRDATIAQVLHSLGERDAQLAALRSEHAKIVPALEATSKSSSQLITDLQAARAHAKALTADLQASREEASALAVQLKRSESETNTARSELAAAKTQGSAYLELLRTREWRSGFDQNMFRELDAQVGAAHLGQGALESERDRLATQVAALEAQVAAQASDAEAERSRLMAGLAARDKAITEALERGSSDALKVQELQGVTELLQAETAKQIAQLQSDQAARIAALETEARTKFAATQFEAKARLAATESEARAKLAATESDAKAKLAALEADAKAKEQEMTVLIAHLQEARRPIQSIEADVKRLSEELAAKSAAALAIEEENAKLRASLERTRGALEEREFLIRRLERSESNNANVLGRIQTSIERLGSVPTAAGAVTPAADWSAELIRIDGEHPVTHVLSRRTRIGRANGCELQIESTSVSRHHALIVVGQREAIIEDLNSTNGVIVNGRKVSRHSLSDGDSVTIGEIHFRYFARTQPRAPEMQPAEPAVKEAK